MPRKSLLVLPLANFSSDPENEYFSDGLTEELINVLSRIEGLGIIARTSAFSLKGQELSLETIGEKLKVSHLLEGSVQKAGSRVRVRLKLVAIEDGFTLWAESYDREMADIFDLQDDIAAEVLQALEIYFRQNFSSSHYTDNISAYEAFLKGHYFFKKDYEGTVKALEFFREATRLDRNYAEAYAYTGECLIHHAAYGLIGTSEAHEEARKLAQLALAINPYEAQAYKLLTYISLFYDWDWEAARDSYHKALHFGLSAYNEFISYYHIFLNGDYQEAISIAKKALESDPLHAEAHWQLGLCYVFARNFKDGIRAFNKALELDARFTEALRWKATALGFSGKIKEAQEYMDRALELSAEDPYQNFNSLLLRLQMGEIDKVREALNSRHFIDSADPAQVYAQMGEKEACFSYLEIAWQERSVMMVSLKHYWIWEKVQEDPRFEDFLARMKFPEKGWEDIPRLSAEVVEPDEEVKAVLSELESLMTEEEAYLDPGLTLRNLAEKLDLHPNKLSWLINEHCAMNFNEYINQYRLESFKEKALDPQNRNLTLLALAYDSGFNSKSVFNEFFKRSTGLSPRAWLKSRPNS